MNAPSQNELVRTVRYEIAAAILDQDREPIASIQTHEDGGRTLTVRHGNQMTRNLETTVQVGRHGELVQASCAMNEFSLGNPQPFRAAAESRERRITDQIKNQLAHKFPQWDQHLNQEHGVVVDRTIRKAAKRIALQDLGGRTPGALGRKLTRAILGNEQYHLTLRTAGADATLREHQIIMWGARTVREAHRMNPNATLLWLRSPSLAPILKYRLPPPCRIIQQAQELFCRTPEARPDPQAAWEAFCNLQPQGVAGTPNMTPALAAAIGHAAARAGCTPAPWALTAITAQDAARRTAGTIIPSFFRESQGLRHAPRERQRHLVQEYRQAIWPSPNSLQDARLMKRLAQEENAEIPPWEQIAGVLGPPDRVPGGPGCEHLEQTAPAMGMKGRGGPDCERNERTATPKEIAEFLERAGPLTLAKLTRDALRIETTPGRELTITLQDSSSSRNEQTAPAAERPGGGGPGCELNEQTALMLRMGTAHDGENNTSTTLGGTSSWEDSAALPDLWGPRNRSAWTTRGMWTQMAGNILAGWVRENWRPDGPRLPRQQALAQICRETLSRLGLDRERELTRELQRGLRKMFNPDTVALARRAGNEFQVTLQQYRIARLGEEHINDLLQHNPGALAWCWLRMKEPQDILHPGQIVREARSGLEALGVNPRHWPNTRRLGLNLMREILSLEDSNSNPGQSAAATALNILGTGGIIPSYGQTQLLKDILSWGRLQTDSPLAIRNMATLVRLFPWKPEDGEIFHGEYTQEYLRIRNVEDYCRAMTREQTTIRSRTFQGLERRSTQWHRQIREDTIRQIWENKIQAQDGRHHAWNSLVPESREDRITITPLSDEKMLLQEAAVMNNCVYSYGEQAAQGRSRIFSIRIDGEHTATVEIAPDPNSRKWSLVQVQGPWNHNVGPEIYDIAQDLAKRYQKAWQEHPEHRSWMVREDDTSRRE